MTPKLVKHPETGQPVLEVVSYQGVELSQLQQEVDAAVTALSASEEQAKVLVEQLQNLQETRVAQEATLEEAKSNLASYQELAAGSGDEAGTAGSGSDVETPVEDDATSTPAVDGAPEGESVPDESETPAESESTDETTEPATEGEAVPVAVAEDDAEF